MHKVVEALKFLPEYECREIECSIVHYAESLQMTRTATDELPPTSTTTTSRRSSNTTAATEDYSRDYLSHYQQEMIHSNMANSRRHLSAVQEQSVGNRLLD